MEVFKEALPCEITGAFKSLSKEENQRVMNYLMCRYEDGNFVSFKEMEKELGYHSQELNSIIKELFEGGLIISVADEAGYYFQPSTFGRKFMYKILEMLEEVR